MATLSRYIFSKKKQPLWRVLLIFLTLIISLLHGIAHFALMQDMGWNYQSTIFITSFEAWDSEHYIAQIKEIYEGHFLLSNSYLAEHKETVRSSWPKFPYYLVAFIGKILCLPIYFLVVFMDLFFPPLIFILAYLLLYNISFRQGLSMLGAFLLTLTPNLLRYNVLPLIVYRILNNGFTAPILNEAYQGYGFSRTINPQLTYSFLLAALLFWVKGISSLKRKHIIATIFFGALTSYSYVFFSTFLYVFLGLSAIILFFLHDKKQLQHTLFILSGILVCAIPFWYHIFSKPEHELQQMSYMMQDHSPIINPQVILTVVVCVFILIGLVRNIVNPLTGIFTFSLLASGIICLNQHVATGMQVQADHYMIYVIPPAAILSLVLLTSDVSSKLLSMEYSSIKSLFLYLGIGLGGISIILSPSFVNAYLSSDGVLTPEFTSFFEKVHLYGFVLGIGLIILSLFSKTFLRNKHSEIMNRLSRIYRISHGGSLLKGVFFILIIGYWTWDVGIGKYQQYQLQIKPGFGHLQKLARSVQWLNQFTEKESVVVCSPYKHSTAGIITMYTDNNVYLSEFAQYYNVPSMQELHARLYNLMIFMGISSLDEFNQFMSRIFMKSSFVIYQKKQKKELYQELKKYRADYLFYGPEERELFKVEPATYDFLKMVYTDNDVIIYQIL